jgi:hypothetical protein
MATTSVVLTSTRVSTNDLRRSPATAPAIRPMTASNTKASTPSLMVTGQR